MSSPSREIEGLVLRVDAKLCHVGAEGETHAVPLRGRLFEASTHESRPIAVGDRVLITAAASGWAIREVLPRSSQLSRTRVEREQVLAANISLVLVVASIRDPTFKPDLVDRILAGAEREEIPAALVITKMDRDAKGQGAEWARVYEALGYPVFLTSIAEGASTAGTLQTLGEVLHRNISVFCGLSGVGKSSLINELIPGLDLRVGSIGKIRQGKHTTTATQLVPLPGGGHVLDTPGIRNFGLFELKAREVRFLFRELKALLSGCEFRDCTHRHEPGCGVLAALERGDVARSRHQSYCLMLAEAESGGASGSR